jgi:hypothetical protein
MAELQVHACVIIVMRLGISSGSVLTKEAISGVVASNFNKKVVFLSSSEYLLISFPKVKKVKYI